MHCIYLFTGRKLDVQWCAFTGKVVALHITLIWMRQLCLFVVNKVKPKLKIQIEIEK